MKNADDGEITANANLIAAAPELYKALDTAMRLLREVWNRNRNPDHPIWKDGPAALAKARGESPAAGAGGSGSTE